MQVLNVDSLESRMQNHAKENLYFVFGVMKSGTLALAAVMLYRLLGAAWNGDSTAWMRLPAWVASFLVTWLTYNNVSVFSNLTTYDTGGEDLFILFLKTQVEMLLFLVLASPGGWLAWPVLYGIIAGISYLKIKRFIGTMEPYRYQSALHPLLRFVREWATNRDLPNTFWAGCVLVPGGISLVLLVRFHRLPLTWANSIVLCSTVLSVFSMALAARTGNRVRKEILKALENNRAAVARAA